jgi:cephalosporin hydroxylase
MRPSLTSFEAGTFRGGSALFMANMLDLLGQGQVVTIDIEELKNRPQHPRIHYLLGSSTAPETIEKVRGFITPRERVMVVLDSDHHMRHVLLVTNLE